MFPEPSSTKNIKKIKSNIFDAIKPFYYFSKCLGTIPFTINGKNNFLDVKTTFNDYLIYFIFNIVYFYLIFLSLTDQLNSIFFETSSKVANTLNQMMILSGIVFAMFLNLINFIFKNSTKEILSNFFEIDSYMSRFNLEVNHKAQSKLLIKFLIFYLFLMILLSLVTGIFFYMVTGNIYLNFMVLFTLILNYLFYANFLCQFVLSLLSVRERFKKINSGLDEIIKRNYDKDLSHVVRSLSRIHDSLNEIVTKINFRFSLWAMIIFGSLFVFSTISIFSFIRTIIYFESRSYYFCLTRIIWFCNYMIFLVGIIAAGSSTTRMVISYFFYKFFS